MFFHLLKKLVLNQLILIEKNIKDAEKRIKELTGKIDKTAITENKKNNQLLDELAEMNKFLSELQIIIWYDDLIDILNYFIYIF